MLEGTRLFHPSMQLQQITHSHDKTSTETPVTYLRLAEKYKACGQWFVAFSSPWVYLAHKRQLRNDYNICTLAAVYRINPIKPTVCSIQPRYKKNIDLDSYFFKKLIKNGLSFAGIYGGESKVHNSAKPHIGRTTFVILAPKKINCRKLFNFFCFEFSLMKLQKLYYVKYSGFMVVALYSRKAVIKYSPQLTAKVTSIFELSSLSFQTLINDLCH